MHRTVVIAVAYRSYGVLTAKVQLKQARGTLTGLPCEAQGLFMTEVAELERGWQLA